MITEILLTLVSIGALSVLGYAVHRISAVATAATSSLAQVKGLSAHHSNPKEFAPDNRSWEAVEQQHIKKTSIQQEMTNLRRKRELEDALAVFRSRGESVRVKQIEEQLEKINAAGA